MIPTMMDSKIFEKSFDAWNLATVTSTVWGPESNMAQKSSKRFFTVLLMAMDDQTKLDFFEYLEKVKVRLDSWG